MSDKPTVETLAEWLRKNSPALASADTIARTLKVSKSTAAAWLAELKASGRVTYEKQGRSGGIVTWVEKLDELPRPLKSSKNSGLDESNRPNRTDRIVQPIAHKSQLPAVLDELKLVQSSIGNRPNVSYLPWVTPDDSRTNAVLKLDESESSSEPVQVASEIVQPATEASEPAVQPVPLKLTLPSSLPVLRTSNGIRLVSGGAIVVSIIMIAVHSASGGAATPFHWWATLAMAVILSSGKVFLGSQAEQFLAAGERGLGAWCILGALFLLSVDASLLYAFRGDSLSNAAAMEKAAMESRTRVKTRLDVLMAEQARLNTATGPTAATDVRLVAEVEADLRILESVGDCRMITPRAKRGQKAPEPAQANPRRCETTRGALAAEMARAKDAAGDEARSVATAEKREKRLAELPPLIEAAENELGQMQARATPDHGASIVARGLNWIPAGVSSVLWGEEVRPVEGRGVEIFWSWAFVLAAELFAVGGFAIAARADRRARRCVASG